jgi:flagellar biosynthesis GTPase FlhF
MSNGRFPHRTKLAYVLVLAVLTLTAPIAALSYAVAPGRAARVRIVPRLTLAATPAVVVIGTPVTFTGTIVPSHIGEHVVLQRLIRGRWKVIAVGSVAGAGGPYAIMHIFRLPSGNVPASLRVKLRGRAIFAPFRVTILRRPQHRHAGSGGRRRLRIQQREERRARHRRAVEERRVHHRLAAEERRRRQLAQEQQRRHRHEAEERRLRERREAQERRQHHLKEAAERRRRRLREAEERRRREAEERRKSA